MPQHERSVKIGQSRIHYSSNGKITTAELYLWGQNGYYLKVCILKSAQHVMFRHTIRPVLAGTVPVGFVPTSRSVYQKVPVSNAVSQ